MDSGGVTITNAQANRVRGIAAPDAGINNYPTNNRVPFGIRFDRPWVARYS